MFSEINKIDSLKRKARKHYIAYHDILSEKSCGAQLGEYLDSNLNQHRKKFNAILDELSLIDSDCPKTRL